MSILHECKSIDSIHENLIVFIREIPLTTRIPENAELEAYYLESGAGLEILVPKHNEFSEEREVHVFLPPQVAHKDSLIS